MERLKEVIDEFGIKVLFETKQDYLDYLRDKKLDSPNYIRFNYPRKDNKDFEKGEPSKYPCVLWYTLHSQEVGNLIIFEGEYIYI